MKLNRFPGRTLAKVVAFSVLAAVFTVGLGVKIGNLRLFKHTYTLEAQFADASGVFKGDAVKLAGVDVGRVEGAEIENGYAIVKFNLDESVKITSDSVVAIRWRNILGQRFLYVYPGDGRGAALDDGDRVPLAQTEDAGDLGEFLNQLGPILKAIDPDKANAFLDSMNTALAGNEGAVRQLIGEGAFLAGRLSSMDDQIKSLIGSSDTVMATYAAQDQSIGRILDDLNILGARLEGMTGDINSVITNFAVVQQQLNKLLTESRDNIDATISSLNSVSANLRQNRSNLENTLCTLPAGVSGYFQTTSFGEWFNVRIVDVVLKDNHGNYLADVEETDDQRPPKAEPPYKECAGTKGSANVLTSGARSKAATAQGGNESAPLPGDLGGLVGLAVGGGTDA
jgi:phospholipid/cholesterol/gamma-HCH transport system substrate-binding protein